MSFFGKLKDRLFKSSSRLEEGLDAIVAERGEVEPAHAPDRERVPEAGPPGPETPPPPEPLPEPHDAAPAPEPDDFPPEPQPDHATGAPEPDHAPRAPEPDDAPPEPEPDDVPPTPEPVQEPEPRPVPQAPPEMPEPVPGDVPDPETPPARDPRQRGQDVLTGTSDPEEVEAQPGFFGRLLGRRTAAAPVMRRLVDDEMLESLEDLLIASDMGVDTALRVTANLAEGHFGRKLSTTEIKTILAAEIARIMQGVATPMPLYPSKPQVVLVVGVNGSGKTTTIGKLASQFRAAGKSVIIAAGDTFRAAAVEQLQIWGQRAGVPVMTAPQNSDPASLAFDAMVRAQAEGTDLLMIDTAGRLQNRADLMEELAKIVRVIRKKDPEAPHNTILVLDATTGQNALSQVEIFRRMADVTGLVMTKLDGTAKGGVLVALADKFGLPIHAIGVGEQIDDLDAFDPEDFARALTGADA